jgi:hypothetical protein
MTPIPFGGIKEKSMGMALFIITVAVFLVAAIYAILKFPKDEQGEAGQSPSRNAGKKGGNGEGQQKP